MYKHILIGFDDSEDSMKALEKAEPFYALNHDCKITVAHVIQDHLNGVVIDRYNYPVIPSISGTIYSPHIPEPEDKLPPTTQQTIDERHQQILDHAKSFLNRKGIPAEFESLDGKPDKDLCDYALENQVDLIIVGHSGKGVLKKLLAGSVSENVMKKAEMDVLIVK